MTSRYMGILFAAIPFLFIVVFVGLPTIQSFIYTLGYTGGPNQLMSEMALHQIHATHGPTLAVYKQLWNSASFRADAWATVWVTLISVIVLLLISWALALYLRFSNGWLARAASTLYLIPMFVPGVIAAYALVTFWNQGGYMGSIFEHLGDKQFSGLGYSLRGIVLGQVWTGIPFAVLMIASGLRNVPDYVIEAARDVGANAWVIGWRILVPLNVLPTAIVATFSVIGSLGAYTIPFVMGPTAPQLLGVTMASYFGAYNEPQQSEAMAVMIFIAAAAAGFIYVLANMSVERRSGVHR